MGVEWPWRIRRHRGIFLLVNISNHGSATVHVDAAPEAVYKVVSDVTRFCEWSPQTVRCQWVDAASGPAVGARFRARNRRGWMRWSNTPEVIAAQPGREFAFKRRAMNSEVVWRYLLEASGSGTDITESYDIVKPAPAAAVWMFRTLGGIKDVDSDLAENLRTSLDRLAKVVSQSAG